MSLAKIIANLSACEGYANCVMGANDYFDIDDDGVVMLPKVEIDEKDRKRVEGAVRSCPTGALRIEE